MPLACGLKEDGSEDGETTGGPDDASNGTVVISFDPAPERIENLEAALAPSSQGISACSKAAKGIDGASKEEVKHSC